MLHFVLPALALAAALNAAPIPTPESHFGHPIGANRILLDWDQVVSYFYKLDKAAPSMIRVKEVGKSVEGRPFIEAIISSPENIRQLNKYLEIQHRLADPRTTTPAQAEPMFAQGKNIIMMTCSIHATEVASTHSAVEFAYKMLTDQSPRFQTIRQNTILILVPSLNPDGVDIVTRWYRKTLNTPYEGSQPPELWQHYVGHDNNRDWYIFSQPETRAAIGIQNTWHPEIVYDVHQQGADASRIFIPPWLDPIEPNVDPILSQEMNMIGISMATDLTSAGKTGVAVHAAYDFWTPSRHYQSFHGGLRILTESASARLATPITISFDQLSTHPLGYNAQEKSWNYLEPWPGGTWHLRDIIDYQLLAFESCLYNAAIHREDMLRAFYKVGQRAVARTKPYAWIIPAQQRDPGATRRMLETLAYGLVEINKAPNGDHVILMQQPYSSWAKALLERQHYPNDLLYPGGPPKRPYDTTAETLPLLFGVDAHPVDEPVTEKLTRESFPFEAPPAKAYSAADTDSWHTVTALWKSGKPVWRNEQTGDFSTTDQGAGWKKITSPRIALYKSWVASMDEGWTRWLFDNFGFNYKDVSDQDLKAGDLKSKFDVIIFPDQNENAILHGYRKGAMPDEYTGGLGDTGIAAVKQFASVGGTVLCFNHAASFCADDLGAEAKNIINGRVANGGDEFGGGGMGLGGPAGGGRGGRGGGGRQNAGAGSAGDFYSPGSLLNVKLDLSSPLTRGLPEHITIWSEQSPAFTTSQQSIATYPASDILASGWLLGPNLIANKSAIVDAKVGEGHVVLYGMRPQYRAQSYQSFKLLFNALVAYE
ncbi:MAG TPA: M14 metallopeptidase family protein [Bryobacteraceae bacterium]|nr:M14 metallopeptidase family protein [Bryobacteraceae bacterium]